MKIIVATDAIGLGLNLKLVFFSNIIKFDGIKRRLTFDEMSQISDIEELSTGNLKKEIDKFY